MSPWSTSSSADRAQTDPIPALLAITILAAGFTMYATFVVDMGPGSSDRELANPTMTSVWSHIQEGGVYDADETDLRSAVTDPSVLPEGAHVYLRITRIDERDGERVTVQDALYGPDGATKPDLRETVTDEGFPEDASVASRSIPIRVGRGEVRAARFHVVVWNG